MPVLIILALAAVSLAGSASSAADGATETPTRSPTAEPTATPTEVTTTPEPTATPLTTYAACLADTVRRPELSWIIDKTRPLPDGYVPPNLVTLPNELVAPGYEGRMLDAEAAGHFEEMVAAAAVAGFQIGARSTYRSYEEQVWTFHYWVEQLGQAEAERVSAKPGHSEHQLGTTADTTTLSVGWRLDQLLGEMPEGVWMFENAYRFGFVESYPVDDEQITGYAYEPWHLRYIGVDCATAWHESGLTPVEFLEQLAADRG